MLEEAGVDDEVDAGVALAEVEVDDSALLVDVAEDEGDESELLLPAASPDLTSCFDSVFLLAGAAPLFLKSVAYQPPPFNWKPAAVTILLNVAFLHSGQSVSIGSLIR